MSVGGGSQLRWLGLLAAFLSLAAPAQEVTLRTAQQAGSTVKYDPEGPPQKPGLCMEILHAVEKADPGLHFTGLEQHVPLKRVERLLAEGLVDAFFCLLKSPEREKQWHYSPVPLYVIRHVVVQRADDTRHFDTLADLAAISRSKRVLVMRGTAIARHLLTANVAIAEVGSEREALQMLSLGRADLIYGQDINLQRHITDTRQGDKFKLGRTIFQEEPQYLALRADLPPAQEERLTQLLRKLERDGVLRQLAEKYR
jgi:ABC-type amino acid transport substrate-binding protein